MLVGDPFVRRLLHYGLENLAQKGNAPTEHANEHRHQPLKFYDFPALKHPFRSIY
ncbi:hypothetical protein D030_2718 [Vibrio parahaemolyticus AQ3810]|nr:hypothetical protein D046_5493 [Vibrio parahaemolyticus V-223/04]EXF69742.1 hypothetical protein D030_2718 [Vibrio parahaemolyticus AQ3810]